MNIIQVNKQASFNSNGNFTICLFLLIIVSGKKATNKQINSHRHRKHGHCSLYVNYRMLPKYFIRNFMPFMYVVVVYDFY